MIKDEAYWASVRAEVDKAPPLTQEMKDKLTVLLQGRRTTGGR